MLHTAEAVAIGHPDKVCDQIADAVLDECLTHDPHTRSAVELLGGHGKLFIVGEMRTRARITKSRAVPMTKARAIRVLWSVTQPTIRRNSCRLRSCSRANSYARWVHATAKPKSRSKKVA